MTSSNFDREMMDWFAKNGIPSKYHRMSLRDAGPVGQRLYDLFSDIPQRIQYFTDHPMLNLYGQDANDSELQILVVRYLVRLKHTAGFCSMGRLPKLSEEDLEDLLTKDVLGIGYCYDTFYKASPISEENLHTISNFLYEFFDNGGIVITTATSPIKDWEWFPEKLRKKLIKIGKDVCSDSRN